MTSDYAWIIDRDHLAEEFEDDYSDEGVIGPCDADVDDNPGSFEDNKRELSENYQHHHQFRMYDDDGELYYTGTLFWNGSSTDPEEHQVFGPLGDFGTPNAGAVAIRYTGKPEWDCG